MAKTLLLLGPDDMSKYSNISGNVDLDKMTPHIYSAQIVQLKPILGVDLYNKIVADYSGDTLAGEYEIIYNEFVVDILVNLSAARFITYAPFQLNNGGVFRHTPENSDSADVEDVKFLVTQFNQMASSIELMFYDYMKDIDIPEYKKNCNGGSNSFSFPWQI